MITGAALRPSFESARGARSTRPCATPWTKPREETRTRRRYNGYASAAARHVSPAPSAACGVRPFVQAYPEDRI